MGRRRGFFAELQHQQRVREQLQRREQAAVVQAHNRAVREEARLRREYERELANAQRLQARSTAESLRAHKALQVATAEVKTAQAVDVLDQIDSILSATLDVDDYVDIDALKQSAQHPPFSRDDLKTPIPEPQLQQAPPEPHFEAPPPPAGLSKYPASRSMRNRPRRRTLSGPNSTVSGMTTHTAHCPSRTPNCWRSTQRREQKRAKQLADARATYQSECDERERIVAETNEKLDTLKRALEAGDPDAIREYIGIVSTPRSRRPHHPVYRDGSADLRAVGLALGRLRGRYGDADCHRKGHQGGGPGADADRRDEDGRRPKDSSVDRFRRHCVVCSSWRAGAVSRR